MAAQDQKIVELRRKQAEYLKTPVAVSEIYPGFSKRLNALIDLTDLGIPELDSGRQAYFAGVVDVSKMITGDWLKKDKPPKALTLKRIIRYLLEHVEGDYNPLRVEIWLLYGDERSENPFTERTDDKAHLIPLAATLIAKTAKDLDIAPSQFDLNAVLEKTMNTLSDFEILHQGMIETAHKKIIEQHIKSHLR